MATASEAHTVPEALLNFDLRPDSAYVRCRVAAAMLGCSQATVWRLAKAGKLESRKLSERVTGFRVGSIRAVLGA
jgi:predicted DNA-binding transcriptional regulator AlpA